MVDESTRFEKGLAISVAEELLRSVSGKMCPQEQGYGRGGKRMVGLTGPGLPGADGKRTEDAGDFFER